MTSQLPLGRAGIESTRRCGEIMALVAFLTSATLAEDQTVISPATREDGVITHEIESSFQQGKTKLRVLLPDDLPPDEKLPVIYVLPVEAKDEARYGDGLPEAQRHDLHNKHRTIFVAPTFSDLPWYADHPANKAIRQESY